MPLIVLTADRPPELRGIGAGQTIDQLDLYGTAARWFCEVGTHEADDAGLLHFRSVACRAFATAAGDPRPGPVHLNLAWRDPLGPEPRPGEVTASAPLALAGRDGERPLTVVPRPATPAPEPLVEATAERLRAAPRGVIVAGRIVGPAPARAARRARSGDRLPDPRRADLAAPLRPPRSRSGDRAPTTRSPAPDPSRSRPTSSCASARCPPASRCAQWLADLPDAGPARRRPGRGLERADADRAARSCGRTRPPSARRSTSALGEPDAERGWADAWLAAATAARGAIDAELASLGELTEPGLHAALGAPVRDGDLVYTASSMPIRDQEAFLAGGEAEVRFLSNRGANGIDGLISSGIGAATASGRPTWIVTGDLGLHHDVERARRPAPRPGPGAAAS